ncbi:MAG: hypothetical protein KGI89_03000 [Euryarchaeota archaeon]|nr:hypothetical protein [Euryarchaeota archaeon]
MTDPDADLLRAVLSREGKPPRTLPHEVTCDECGATFGSSDVVCPGGPFTCGGCPRCLMEQHHYYAHGAGAPDDLDRRLDGVADEGDG